MTTNSFSSFIYYSIQYLVFENFEFLIEFSGELGILRLELIVKSFDKVLGKRRPRRRTIPTRHNRIKASFGPQVITTIAAKLKKPVYLNKNPNISLNF